MLARLPALVLVALGAVDALPAHEPEPLAPKSQSSSINLAEPWHFWHVDVLAPVLIFLRPHMRHSNFFRQLPLASQLMPHSFH